MPFIANKWNSYGLCAGVWEEKGSMNPEIPWNSEIPCFGLFPGEKCVSGIAIRILHTSRGYHLLTGLKEGTRAGGKSQFRSESNAWRIPRLDGVAKLEESFGAHNVHR